MVNVSELAPGVYLKELSGDKPISGVGTALPAFLGLAPKGPSTPTLVANWTQFTDTFGGPQDGMALGRAVYAYLSNGGKKCVVVRCGGGEDQATSPASATVSGAGGDAFVATAKRAGSAGNSLSVVVSEPPQASEADDTSAEGEEATAETAGATGSFDVRITGAEDQEEESYPGLTEATLVEQLRRSSLVSISAPAGGRVGRPSPGTTQLSGGSDGSPAW
jgi:uncharacterized protein